MGKIVRLLWQLVVAAFLVLVLVALAELVQALYL